MAYSVDSGLDAVRAVDSLYRCALQGGSWEETAGELRAFLRCTCVCLAWQDGASGRIHRISSRRPGDRVDGGQVLRCEVIPAKLFDQRIMERSVAIEALESSRGVSGPSRMRLYAWHREAGRCPYCVGARVDIEAGASAYLGAHWYRVEDLIGADGEERLKALAAPFVRALRLRARLAQMPGSLDASQALLEPEA